MPGIKHVQFRFRRKKYKDHEQIQRVSKNSKVELLEDSIAGRQHQKYDEISPTKK